MALTIHANSWPARWDRAYSPCWPGDRSYVLDVKKTSWDNLGNAARDVAIARVRAMLKAHGLGIHKFQAEYKKRGMVGEDKLVDKAGFHEEAMELIKPKVVAPGQEVFLFGDLQGVIVSGDTARGWFGCRGEVRVEGVREAIKPGRVLRGFRRMNSRWYNDNREGDLTRYDSPRDR